MTGRWRAGCTAAGVIAAILLLAAGSFAVVTWFHVRSDRERPATVAESVPEIPTSSPAADVDETAARVPLRVELEVAVVEVAVVPAAPGEPLSIEADYDDTRYELVERSEGDPETGWTYRLGLRPRGSRTWALFRVKLGSPPGQLKVRLPRDTPLSISGMVDRSFAALELGGLELDAADLRVHSGAAAVSFFDPLKRPMERLTIEGDTSSIKVAGLGNASPRSAVLEQRVGEIDLDFRGGWVRDAEIRVAGRLAGGTVWLPDNVVIESAGQTAVREERVAREERAAPERALPVLRLDISSKAGQLLFVE